MAGQSFEIRLWVTCVEVGNSQGEEGGYECPQGAGVKGVFVTGENKVKELILDTALLLKRFIQLGHDGVSEARHPEVECQLPDLYHH